MTEDRRFYVYILFRPDGTPCYVGKGKGRRWTFHERKGSVNRHLAYIIKNASGTLPKEKFQEGLTEAEAFQTETCLISAIGRGENGPLVNLTDGGDGFYGYTHSEEARRRIGIAVKNRVIKDSTREKLRRANLGKINGPTHSEEFKQKISKIHKGRVKSVEECANISVAKMGHTVTQATRDKISQKLLGRTLTEEQKLKVSDGVRNSPKTKARIIPIPTNAIVDGLNRIAPVTVLAKKYGVGRRLLCARIARAVRTGVVE